MMNLFPTIYEGELLYSVISRYKRVAAIVNKRALVKDLYGSIVALNSTHFPVHIEKLVENMPVDNKITKEKIISENTLYRVFSAFCNKNQSREVFKGMSNSKAFNAYLKLGLTGKGVGFSDNLLYCEKCLEEDINQYGEGYWRVLYQVPGVFFCNKHNSPLVKSEILTNRSRVDYICADNINNRKGEVVVEKSFINKNKKYVEMVEYILKNDLPKKDKSFFDEVYIDKLRDKGFASKNGSIKIKELTEAFREFYTDDYLKLMQSELKAQDNWLRYFIRNNNKGKHVLRHLLMIEFLDLDLKEVFNIEETKGKRKYIYISNPRLDRDIQRERWIQVLKDNPNLNKCEYKRIGKGLYSWLYKNDNKWFEMITPKKEKVKNLS